MLNGLNSQPRCFSHSTATGDADFGSMGTLGWRFRGKMLAHCTKCGAEVGADSKFCGECGAQVTTAPAAKPAAKEASTAETIGGCLGLLVFFGLLYSCVSGGDDDPKATAAKAKADTAQAALDNMKGFHCLSGWDGSNRSLVTQIKQRLRDPDSFEHDETRITPNDGGKHMVTMRYRARNGFGGMNVSTAMATVDHTSCEATIISTGEE